MSYRVRVLNDEKKEVGKSEEIPAIATNQAAETIAVPKHAGTIRLKQRDCTALLYLEVSHVGGVLGGGDIIGQCQIHRMDPRSSQVWPYALVDAKGEPANCGLELKVVEADGAPLGGTPMGSAAQLAYPFGRPPMSMTMGVAPPLSAPLGTSTVKLGGSKSNAPQMSHGISALLEFDKAADLPYPRVGLNQISLAVLSDETHKELRTLGPFAVLDQEIPSRKAGRLARANCAGASVFVQDPLHFGGESEEGAMYIRLALSYSCSHTDAKAAATELVGVTNPIKVSWVPTQTKYYPVISKEGSTLGGIYLRHRLLTEQEARQQPHNEMLSAFEPHGGKMQRVPATGGPVEPMHRVSGRTGTFPKGSREEICEQACINAEAQNRALLQRCKRADPNRHETDPHVKIVNGYREWDSLDSLFATMGPNPLAMSQEVGPTVARSYRENHMLYSELMDKLPPANNPAEEKMNLQLIRMMTNQDPIKVTSALRPVVCKDPDEILAGQDLKWCPDPPVYAPIRNMREEDKETLRLACYAPEMDSQLVFADANPNYRVDEDIWGVLADYKTAESLVVPKNPAHHKRVKDDCIMA